MELHEYDATGLATLIREREISSAEAFDFTVRQIDRLNPELNAVIRTRFDKAEKERQQLDTRLPFAGVPFLTKDLMVALGGEVLGCGSAAMQNYRPPVDAELTQRYKQAGLIIVGQTNTPELGLMGITEPKVYGACRNPWGTSRTPGGSSGGSASAVAARIVPMASGGDGGGSIRIPASCCGLFGLKPSRGRQPMGPYVSDAWGGAVSEHVITRSVRDSAAMLDITNGMDAGAPYPVFKETGFLTASQTEPKPLRIGFTYKSPIGSPVSKDCIDAINNTVNLLQELGHHTEEVDLPLDGEQLASSFLTMLLSNTAATVNTLAQKTQTPVNKMAIERPTRALYKVGSKITASDYIQSQLYWNELRRNMGQLHQSYDVILTPTLADTPQPVGSLYPSTAEQLSMRLLELPGMSWFSLKTGIVDKMAMDMLSKMPFTQIANMTGQPSMSVPLHWNKDNLPVGVQFTAAIGEDALLFSLAGQLERTMPWDKRIPDMCKDTQ